MWSAGIHAALGVMLAGGVVLTRYEPPVETALALQAVVVDAATLATLQRMTSPRPVPQPSAAPVAAEAPTAVAPEPRPAPTPEPVPKAVATAAARPADRKAADITPAEPKRDAPAPPKPAPTKPAAPAAVPTVPDAAAREAAERDLQAALDEEERAMALRASGMAVQWGAAIRGRVQRAWIRPDTARSGIDCTVAVTQAPGGSVLAVEVRSCNGDDAVRQSIEDAVRRASPLPPPPDPALFEREILLRFRPDA
jgi:colicin import membrane protein